MDIVYYFRGNLFAVVNKHFTFETTGKKETISTLAPRSLATQ